MENLIELRFHMKQRRYLMTKLAEKLVKELSMRFGDRQRVFKEEIVDLMVDYGKDVWEELFEKNILGYANQILFIEWTNVPRET